MKKLVKVLKYVIVFFVGLFLGFALAAPTESTEPVEDNTVVEEPVVEDDNSIFDLPGDKNEVYDQLVQEIEWQFETDEWGNTTVTGILENTTDEEIDYIEIEYKFTKDGITVDSSFTNETDIQPGEKVKIEIWTMEEFDNFEVKGTTGWE